MITEQGTIKVETKLDENMQKEFMRPLYIVSLVCLIAGSIGLAAYLAWDITASVLGLYEPNIVILIFVAGAFAFGLIFVLSRNQVMKKVRSEDRTEVYEFFSDYFISNDYLNGEQVATVKTYYKQIVKRKETANYIFVYVQAAAALPISKASMTEGELNTVRALLGFSANGGTPMQLPSGDKQSETAVEPFEEMKEE